MAFQKKTLPRDVGVDDPRIPDLITLDAAVKGDERPPLINGQPTVNGNPFPPGFEHAIAFANTDQGRWDTNHGANMRPPSGITSGKDPLSKAMDQRLDQPWSQVDPLKAAIDQVAEPGFRYRALSEGVCNKRGLRGWEPVPDAKGDRVKVGRLFLGRMPESVAEQRNEHYRKIGGDDLKNVEESFALDQEKAGHSGSKGVSILQRGDLLRDTGDPSRGASIGFEQVRGGG
jgi:hypothetical protein